MKKIILKKSRYRNLPETIFGIITSATFLVLILYNVSLGGEILSDSISIGGFIFFSLCLLFFLWRLFAGKQQTHYININGWEYRLFRKTSKWKFICISGLASSAQTAGIIGILYLFDLIKSEMSLLQVLLIVAAISVVLAFPYGYKNYKNCASVDPDSDVKFPS